ncbi:MAG: fluoroacetyl-CoA thioesterase [Bacteroidia bacterium]|jgi:fluoroacetyl-CoA thioesterase
MKNPFEIGAIKMYEKEVTKDEVASFETGNVHPFYATFSLARDAEWGGRLFVLEMKDDDEEGIGTFLSIKHKSPAGLGDLVRIETTLVKVLSNKITCSFVACVDSRIIATGETGQMILKKSQVQAMIKDIDVR